MGKPLYSLPPILLIQLCYRQLPLCVYTYKLTGGLMDHSIDISTSCIFKNNILCDNLYANDLRSMTFLLTVKQSSIV